MKLRSILLSGEATTEAVKTIAEWHRRKGILKCAGYVARTVFGGVL